MVNFTRKTFEPGQLVFDDGDAAETVYLLRSGAVEIRIGTQSGSPRTLGNIKPGEIFGEMALLEDRSHRAAAVIREKSVIFEVPRQDFFNRLDALDPVMKSVFNHLLSRLRNDGT